MSHPDDAHGLKIQLATALRERDEARALKLEEVMGATKRICDERDALRAEVKRLREALEKAADGLRHGEAADLSPVTAELPIVSWRAIRDAYHAARAALTGGGDRG